MTTTNGGMAKLTDADLSIVLPARNEAASLTRLLPELRKLYPAAEIIVVDDGSDDATATVSREAGAEVVSHPYSKGNGAAVKSGARHASRDWIVCMDADGQHRPGDITALTARATEGHDLVVGARSASAHAGWWRRLANSAYNRLASWIVGHTVEDLTSGFRLVRAKCFREFLHVMPNGFSNPTTTTMAFFRAGYGVTYVPVNVAPRQAGTASHIRLLQDGSRFLIIIFKMATLYSPLKIFLPISLGFFAAACGYYAYTFITAGQFTNFGALLAITSVLVFLIGLISEQITSLVYGQSGG